MRLKLSFALLASIFSCCAVAQQQQHVAACTDKALHAELVSWNNAFEQRGFKLVQFQTMDFPSGAYVPVTVNMEAGKMYQINFFANKDFQQCTLTLLDKNKAKLISKKIKQKDAPGHKISESFTAPYSGDFYIILTQKVKGRDAACGGISVLKAVNN